MGAEIFAKFKLRLGASCNVSVAGSPAVPAAAATTSAVAAAALAGPRGADSASVS